MLYPLPGWQQSKQQIHNFWAHRDEQLRRVKGERAMLLQDGPRPSALI